MSEPDYTQIQDGRIRGVICELMSEMLDNPDEHGIYPTSRFMWKMEGFVLAEVKRLDGARMATLHALRQSGRDKWLDKAIEILDAAEREGG